MHDISYLKQILLYLHTFGLGPFRLLQSVFRLCARPISNLFRVENLLKCESSCFCTSSVKNLNICVCNSRRAGISSAEKTTTKTPCTTKPTHMKIKSNTVICISLPFLFTPPSNFYISMNASSLLFSPPPSPYKQVEWMGGEFLITH